jgi:hypothetical protein
MPLTPGTRLGPYEILAPIGVGPAGAPERITDTAGPMRAGSVSRSGTFLFCSLSGAGRVNLYSVKESGGSATRIAVPGLPEGCYHGIEFLPDSDDFLFAFVPVGAETAGIYLARLIVALGEA